MAIPILDHANYHFQPGFQANRSALEGATVNYVHEPGLERPVVYLDVKDGFEHVPGRHEITSKLAELEDFLLANPDIGLDDPDNKAREWVYSTPTIHRWAEMMPSAAALYPLQRPDAPTLPGGYPIDDLARYMFMHSPDAIGIRTRAKVMSLLTKRYAHEFARTERRPMRWVSVACGAAVPILDARQDIYNDSRHATPLEIEMMLVDHDQSALDFARQLSEEQGVRLPEESFMNRDLIRGMLAGDSLIDEIGAESVDFVDMLGIFEYFDDRAAQRLLRQAYRLVAPGGKAVVANMLTSHPNLQVNQRGVGWPSIHPRNLSEVVEIARKAGIPDELIDVYVPTDRIYGVVMINKPKNETTDSHTASVRELGKISRANLA